MTLEEIEKKVEQVWAKYTEEYNKTTTLKITHNEQQFYGQISSKNFSMTLGYGAVKELLKTEVKMKGHLIMGHTLYPNVIYNGVKLSDEYWKIFMDKMLED